MSTVLRFLGVAGLAAIDLFLAIPAGIAAGYDFLELFLAMAVGGSVGAVVTVLVGDEASKWWAAHRKVRSRPKPSGWITKAVDRFGAPGLGLLAPVVVGSPGGAMIGIGLGLNRGAIAGWLIAGTVIWSAVLAGLTAAGASIAG